MRFTLGQVEGRLAATDRARGHRDLRPRAVEIARRPTRGHRCFPETDRLFGGRPQRRLGGTAHQYVQQRAARLPLLVQIRDVAVQLRQLDRQAQQILLRAMAGLVVRARQVDDSGQQRDVLLVNAVFQVGAPVLPVGAADLRGHVEIPHPLRLVERGGLLVGHPAARGARSQGGKGLPQPEHQRLGAAERQRRAQRHRPLLVLELGVGQMPRPVGAGARRHRPLARFEQPGVVGARQAQDRRQPRLTRQGRLVGRVVISLARRARRTVGRRGASGTGGGDAD